LRSGDASEAAKWAQEAIALEPFRESGYRRLMHAHAAAGNRAEALQTYERCRRLLAEELGAYPSPETESIYRELLGTAPVDGGLVPGVVATSDGELPHALETREIEAVPFAAHEGQSTPAATGELAGRRWRPSRRVIVGTTVTAAAAGAALGILLTRGGGSTATSQWGRTKLR
jgi:8-oxo-dGTP pyrophosphatase MutT (NUDIX family)